MKSKIIRCIVFASVILRGNAQQIELYQGTVPVIDGIISPGEWNDTDSLQLAVSGSNNVTVKCKHDGSNFYFVFYNHLESSIRFPELSFDVNNNKSSAWQSDDWWFHVSATDCEANAAGDYSNCALVQPGWEGVQNITSGPPITDTVEIKIPFAKLGFLYSGGDDTVGLAIDVSNTSSAWNFWPAGANKNNPATWGNAVLHGFTMVVNENMHENKLQLFPNPVADRLYLKTNVYGTYAIIAVTGQIVETGSTDKGPNMLSLNHLKPGAYLLQVKAVDGSIECQRFLKL